MALVEFLWQLMVHVLPRGLHRVRHYGILHGNARRRRALVQVLLRLVAAPARPPAPQPFLCSRCGSAMRALRFVRPRPT